MTNRDKYNAFIAAIDNSIAGKDDSGHNLRWNIECSAEANASDMNCKTEEDYYAAALSTAIDCYDDWKGYYPFLILK